MRSRNSKRSQTNSGSCIGRCIVIIDKIISADKFASLLQDGMTIMVGGFMSCGTPQKLMDIICEKGIKNLTVIGNDSGLPNDGIGKLIAAGCVTKLIASHIGLNPQTGQLMHEDKIEVCLVPQGTLVERIRAGGAGLGGVLTPTGLGTEVAVGKDIIEVDGKEYILEKPLRADMALLFGSSVDFLGNIFYKGTTRNFNPIMATAADTVVVESQKLVNVGEIQGECIATPGIFVDYIVKGGAENGL